MNNMKTNVLLLSLFFKEYPDAQRAVDDILIGKEKIKSLDQLTLARPQTRVAFESAILFDAFRAWYRRRFEIRTPGKNFKEFASNHILWSNPAEIIGAASHLIFINGINNYSYQFLMSIPDDTNVLIMNGKSGVEMPRLKSDSLDFAYRRWVAHCKVGPIYGRNIKAFCQNTSLWTDDEIKNEVCRPLLTVKGGPLRTPISELPDNQTVHLIEGFIYSTKSGGYIDIFEWYRRFSQIGSIGDQKSPATRGSSKTPLVTNKTVIICLPKAIAWLVVRPDLSGADREFALSNDILKSIVFFKDAIYTGPALIKSVNIHNGQLERWCNLAIENLRNSGHSVTLPPLDFLASDRVIGVCVVSEGKLPHSLNSRWWDKGKFGGHMLSNVKAMPPMVYKKSHTNIKAT